MQRDQQARQDQDAGNGAHELKAVRLVIDAHTASFRVPHTQSNHQATWPTIPPTALQGLLEAMLGLGQVPPELEYAAAFRGEWHGKDYQTGWNVGGQQDWRLGGTQQPFERELIGHVRLILHLRGVPDLAALANQLSAPAHSLCMGRPEDVAWMARVPEVAELAMGSRWHMCGVMLPAEEWRSSVVGGRLVTLARKFTGREFGERLGTVRGRMIYCSHLAPGGEVDARTVPGRRVEVPCDPEIRDAEGRALGLAFIPLFPSAAGERTAV